MKSINSTLLPGCFAFKFKTAARCRHAHNFNHWLTTVFLFVSFVSFAGEVTSNPHPYPGNGMPAAVIKATASPLTGPESIRTNLYLLGADNKTILADGVYTEYNNLYHDSVTQEDAYKFTNIRENLGLTRYGSVLAVERRPVISFKDTLFFKLWKTTQRDYQLEFIAVNLDHPGLQGFVEDTYSGTRTLLALSGTTKINFTVNADAASGNASRFRIVYKTSSGPTTLPVTFTSVNGYQLNNKITIDWNVDNEINIDRYEVERSVNGTDFIIESSTMADGQSLSNNSYSWMDENPVKGNNFYRIKSVDRNGSKKVSLIVKVSIGKTGAGTVTIYPNPIRGNMVNLQFTNQPVGIYLLRLINNNGQAVYSTRLPISSPNTSQTLFTNKKLAGGIYLLEIVAPDNTVRIQRAVVQE